MRHMALNAAGIKIVREFNENIARETDNLDVSRSRLIELMLEFEDEDDASLSLSSLSSFEDIRSRSGGDESYNSSFSMSDDDLISLEYDEYDYKEKITIVFIN